MTKEEEKALDLRDALALKIIQNLRYFSDFDDSGEIVIFGKGFSIISKSIAHDIAKMIESKEILNE